MEDVQAIVGYARQKGARVVSRGHACTGFGQALTDQIVLDMKGVTDFRVISSDTIAVGGGNRGLGQTGIIVGAELKVEPLRAFTVQHVRPMLPGQGIAEINELVAKADPSWEIVFAARALDTGLWSVTLGHYRESAPEKLEEGWAAIEHNYRERYKLPDMLMGIFGDVQRKTGLISDPRDICPMIGDWNVPSSEAPVLCEKVKKLFDDPRISPGHFALVLKNARACARLPLSPVPNADMVNSITPWCLVPRSMAADYQARYEEAMETCLQAGGRIYLYGNYPRAKDFFRRQFGEATFNKWLSVKQRYNPGSIVGAELF